MVWGWLATVAGAVTLEDAWRAAEGGEEVALAREQRRDAELTRTQALLALTPKLQLNAHHTTNKQEVLLDFAANLPPELAPLIGDIPPTVIQKKSFFDADGSVIQPLLNLQTVWAYKGTTALVEAARATESGQRAELRLGVARAYWGVLVTREAEAMAQRGVELAQRHVEQARALEAVGTATRQVVLQAEMAVARAERDLVDAAAGRGAAERGFRAVVEVDADGDFAEPTIPPTSWGSPDDVLASSLARRPERVAADARADAARAAATASGVAWVPTLDARFTELWSQNTGFLGMEWNWQLVFTASWTPLDGGYKLVNNLRTASQQRSAEALASMTEEQVAVDVQSTWAERERAHAARAAAERELSFAEENLRIAEKSFDAGASTFLDLEDARVARDGAQIRVLTERMNEHLGTLSLLRLTGDL
jgi:outer membrane protein TolC